MWCSCPRIFRWKVRSSWAVGRSRRGTTIPFGSYSANQTAWLIVSEMYNDANRERRTKVIHKLARRHLFLGPRLGGVVARLGYPVPPQESWVAGPVRLLVLGFMSGERQARLPPNRWRLVQPRGRWGLMFETLKPVPGARGVSTDTGGGQRGAEERKTRPRTPFRPAPPRSWRRRGHPSAIIAGPACGGVGALPGHPSSVSVAARAVATCGDLDQVLD